MSNPVANWTSTEVPLWETDCVQFWRRGLPFALRNVITPEHRAFVEQFALEHRLQVSFLETVAIFCFEGDPGE